MIHPSSATRLLTRDGSMCNVVCHCYDDPINGPMGNPTTMRAPGACNEACFLVFLAGITQPANHLDSPSGHRIGDPGIAHLP